MFLSIEGAREEEKEERVIQDLYRKAFPVCWCCLGLVYEQSVFSYRTFALDQEKKWQETLHRQSFDPLFYRELKVHLLAHFNIKILYSSDSVN